MFKRALWFLVLCGLIVSAINPHDRLTWFLEVVWVILGLPLTALTAKKFPVSHLLYVLLATHAMVLIIGGHYTYERTPLGLWLQEIFGFSRNHYDRVGHFFQGFVPAILAREILIRLSPVREGGWLFFVTTAICLAFSAAFEIFEWLVACILGQAAEAFLALQGDPWDTQWDMFLCLFGAILSQMLLSRIHNEQLKRLAITQT